MDKENIKKYALNTFAFTLFCMALYYLFNAKGTALLMFGGLPMGILVVYVTAFIDIAIASSIVMSRNVQKTCYWGGIYWAVMSVVSLFSGMFQSAEFINYLILNFLISIGYTAAIFYISAEAEDE
jgi:hypothetical protein